MHVDNGILIKLSLDGQEMEESIRPQQVAHGKAKLKLSESTAINKKAAY